MSDHTSIEVLFLRLHDILLDLEGYGIEISRVKSEKRSRMIDIYYRSGDSHILTDMVDNPKVLIKDDLVEVKGTSGSMDEDLGGAIADVIKRSEDVEFPSHEMIMAVARLGYQIQFLHPMVRQNKLDALTILIGMEIRSWESFEWGKVFYEHWYGKSESDRSGPTVAEDLGLTEEE